MSETKLYRASLTTGKIEVYPVARETASTWIMANPDGSEGAKILKTSQEGGWYHSSLESCKAARLNTLRQVQAESLALQERADSIIREMIAEDAA